MELILHKKQKNKTKRPTFGTASAMLAAAQVVNRPDTEAMTHLCIIRLSPPELAAVVPSCHRAGAGRIHGPMHHNGLPVQPVAADSVSACLLPPPPSSV